MSEHDLTILHKQHDKDYARTYTEIWCKTVREDLSHSSECPSVKNATGMAGSLGIRDEIQVFESNFYDLNFSSEYDSTQPGWMNFLHDSFSALKKQRCERKTNVLDIGCGPSVSNIISASSMFDVSITMADILDSNLEALRHFQFEQESNRLWTEHFNLVGQLEGLNEVDELYHRVRSAISHIEYGCLNLSESNEFDRLIVDKMTDAEFDIIIASHVLDVVCLDKHEMIQALTKLTRTLSKSGHIIIQGALDQEAYAVGSVRFPAMNVGEHEVKEAFAEASLKILAFQLDKPVDANSLTSHYFALVQHVV